MATAAPKPAALAAVPVGMVAAAGLDTAPVVRSASSIGYIEPGFRASPMAPGMPEVIRWFEQQGGPGRRITLPPTKPVSDSDPIPLQQQLIMRMPALVRFMDQPTESTGTGFIPAPLPKPVRPAAKVL